MAGALRRGVSQVRGESGARSGTRNDPHLADATKRPEDRERVGAVSEAIRSRAPPAPKSARTSRRNRQLLQDRLSTLTIRTTGGDAALSVRARRRPFNGRSSVRRSRSIRESTYRGDR